MTSSESYGTNLSEDLITMLCWSDTHGKQVAGLVDPALFAGEYGMIAQRSIEYWRQYNQAPKGHTANLLAPELEAGGRPGAHLQRTLHNMIHTYEAINNEYILDKISRFIHTQKFKDALLRSAQVVCNGGKVEDGEKILNEVLRSHADSKFAPPIKVGDYKAFVQMYSAHEECEFSTGIPLLDMHNATPARDRVSVLIGVLGTGKSWWFIHLGRRALFQNKRVLHVTLELRDNEVWARYYQNFMAVPSNETYRKNLRRKLRLEDGRLAGFIRSEEEAPFSLQGAKASGELERQLEQFFRHRRGLFDNLRIKEFPPGTLTVAQLRGFLEQLEMVENYKPDIVLLDHANCMAIDIDNFRIAFGHVLQELEALAKEKHIAICTAAQANREGAKAKQVDITHIAEDWSLGMTADTVLTLSRNAQEENLGLARLYVGKNRFGAQKYGVVLEQNFKFGQFALESAALRSAEYFALLDELPVEG